MKLILTSVIVALLLLASACSDDDGVDDAPPTPPVTAATVSAHSPSSAATSAATGVAVTVEEGAYTTETVFPQLALERMIEIEAIPGDDNHAAVITQAGMVYRFSLSDESEDPTVYLDITDQILDGAGNEEGLLGIAFPPDFADSHRFYIYYSAGPPRQTVLERYSATGSTADPASAETLLAIDDPFSNHNGGGLEFGPDGFLYLAVGDGGSGGDPQGNGQNMYALLGKIHRFDVSGPGAYAIPPDNPFAGGSGGGGRPEIFAYGFRNPWRITFDRETGDLWTGDVGQGTREEVNLVEAGANYGWNIMEGDLCFAPSDGCDSNGLVMPRAVYENSGSNCSVTGGYVYRGVAMPELIGWYIYGDYCSGLVWGLDTLDAQAQPVLLSETEYSIPSFWQDADGELYIVTFNNVVARFVRQPAN